MFFRKDYAKPGPGVDRDEPEKTGMARLAEIFSIECVTLVKLNLLFLASCLPVVTIPAAVFAMNQVTWMMVQDQAVPLVLSGCGMWFYLTRAMTRPLLLLPFMLCSTVFLLTLPASVYLYGLLVTERSFRECLRLALLLGAGRPLRGAAAALAVYGSLTFAVLEFPISGIYLLLIGFSVPCLLGGFLIRTELRRL